MRRHSSFPKVQGWQLRFEFVPQHPINASSHYQPVACRQHAPAAPRAVAFLYPRFRPSFSRSTISVPFKKLRQRNFHTTLSAPYSQTRIPPACTREWNSASYSTQKFTRYTSDIHDSKTIRTMADPVFRTASPYVDPTVKGPKSQQLSSGLGRSLLQHHKSQSDSLPDISRIQLQGLVSSSTSSPFDA